MKVTYKTTLENILKHENGLQILLQNNVPCPSCPLAAQEISFLTIGEVNQIYNVGHLHHDASCSRIGRYSKQRGEYNGSRQKRFKTDYGNCIHSC